jgi:hypothetical protein
LKAKVAIIGDDALVAADIGRGIASHGGRLPGATAGALAEARSLLDWGMDLFGLGLIDIGRQAVDALSHGTPLSPSIAGYRGEAFRSGLLRS